MKKIAFFLKIAIGAIIGVFLGSSLFTWWEFTAHPERFAMQSAPWYLSIQINAVFTAAVLAFLLILLYFAKKTEAPVNPWKLLSLLSSLTALCTAIWMGFEIFGYHTNYDAVTLEACIIGVCLVLNLIFTLIRLYQEKHP